MTVKGCTAVAWLADDPPDTPYLQGQTRGKGHARGQRGAGKRQGGAESR